MRARTAQPGASTPPSMYGKTGSFLKDTTTAHRNGNGAVPGGRFGWLVVAIVLGAVLGGLAAMAGSCKRDAGGGDGPGTLQAQVDRLLEQNKQLQSALRQCGAGDAAGALDALASASAVPMDTSYYVAEREDVDPELKAALEGLNLGPSGRKEVLVAVSNKALINAEGTYGMLATWIEQVKASGVENAMVVCLDDEIEAAMKKIGFPHWRFRAKVQNLDKNLDNHGISGQKFMILREFLVLGFSPLLSDVDIVTLRNPFDSLHRDSDVEGMTDGFDDMAYMRLEVRLGAHAARAAGAGRGRRRACARACARSAGPPPLTRARTNNQTTGHRRPGHGLVAVRAVVADLLDELGPLLPPGERADDPPDGADHGAPAEGQDVGPVRVQLLRPAALVAGARGLRRVRAHHGLRALHEHEAPLQVPPQTGHEIQAVGSRDGAPVPPHHHRAIGTRPGPAAP